MVKDRDKLKVTVILLIVVFISMVANVNIFSDDTYAATKKSKSLNIPKYSGEAIVEVNNNVPFFTEKDFTDGTYEKYGKLDKLGRCTYAIACISKEMMPTELRQSIGMIKPSGWHLVKYDGIEDGYLYNRCHLIAHQLTGQNANKRNLITGTRYMNTIGMEPYESKVGNYIRSTGNRVLYRVTPIFKRKNLLASGVLMEAQSVEDHGEGIKFCIYCYNVQPNIKINYRNGNSSGAMSATCTTSGSCDVKIIDGNDLNSSNSINSTADKEFTYVLNKNTMKFHYESCPSVQQMKPKNRVYSHFNRDELLGMGYSPCCNCRP